MATPKSVRAINKWPYPFNKFQLGTLFYSWVTLMRNLFAILTEERVCTILTNPKLQQWFAGDVTKLAIPGFDYSISGAIYTKGAAADISVDASAATGASEYKSITFSIDSAGTVTQTVSDASASTPVALPEPPAGECPFASMQVPNSFVPDTTTINNDWITQGWTAVNQLTAAIPDPMPTRGI